MQKLSELLNRSDESPIEEVFWRYMKRTAKGLEHSEAQKVFGRRRVDAFVLCPAGVVVELDGAAFHSRQKDDERDRDLFTDSRVEEIIHVPGRPMASFPDATFAALSVWHQRFTIAANPARRFDHVFGRFNGEDFEPAGDGNLSDEMFHVRRNLAAIGSTADFFGQGNLHYIRRIVRTPDILHGGRPQ